MDCYNDGSGRNTIIYILQSVPEDKRFLLTEMTEAFMQERLSGQMDQSKGVKGGK